MANYRELERIATGLEREADAAKVELSTERNAVETKLQRSVRLAQEAAKARSDATKAKRSWARRTAWIWARLAILAFLLWGFYRIGFEHGYIVGHYH